MRAALSILLTPIVLALAPLDAIAAQAPCPPDVIASGTACIDKYEASVWHVPPQEKGLIRKIQQGQVTLPELLAGGAIQLGIAGGDLAAHGCPDTGNGCVDVYAASIEEVTPARFINWFQAAAAARNALKRLPTNQEWQLAALGTPDGELCNIDPGGSVNATGSAPDCVSDVGAFDMVGNVAEWVADWTVGVGGCFTWPPEFGNDLACANVPTGVVRGGSVSLFGGTEAGVFSVRANTGVTVGSPAGLLGFRGAR